MSNCSHSNIAGERYALQGARTVREEGVGSNAGPPLSFHVYWKSYFNNL